MTEYPFAQGQARPATQEEKDREIDPNPNPLIKGTTPDLHRRIEEGSSSTVEDMFLLSEDGVFLCTEDDELLVSGVEETTEGDKYILFVKSLNSYRYTQTKTHDEDSNDSEIP